MLLCTLVISAIAFASVSENLPLGTENSTESAQQVCKFSVSKTTGTIDTYGQSESFTVLLSCEQAEDINATVTIWIDGEAVANMVVKVSKGKTKSSSQYFSGLKDYKGNKYKLTVE